MKNSKTTSATIVASLSAMALIGFLGSSETVGAEETSPITRLAGETRFHTAVEVSQAGWDSADTIILANGHQFADALTGVPLAHQLDAPILPVQSHILEPVVIEEIERLDPEEIIILGGTAAIEDSVESTLNDMGYPTSRLAGETRYETAAIIADELTAENPTNQAVVTNGAQFVDALSIASFAAQEGLPIYLTETDGLHNGEILSTFDETLIIGGEDAISLNIEHQLNNPTRIGGATRYDTNIAIMEYFDADALDLYVATGSEFADALTGGVLAAENGSGVALTNSIVPAQLENYLEANPTPYFTILGGEEAISTEIESQLIELATDRYDRATIVHTNDIHGRMVAGDGDNDDVMGLALIHGIYDHYAAESEEVILVDSGDTFHGTNNVHLSEGETMVDVMNNMGYFAMAAGNHEFNYGWERLLELDAMAEFPILAGNVIEDATGEPILPATTEWEVFGNTFGVVGLVTEDTPIRTHPDNVANVTFQNDIEAAQEQVSAIEDDVDHIMFLTHSGASVDESIAENVNGIDLIVGGHSHTHIDDPYYVNDTFITQAWEHTKAAGVVHLDFVNGELTEMSGYTHTLENGAAETFTPNESTQELTEGIVGEVEEEMSEVIGSIDVFLDGSRETVRQTESNLGNLIADSVQARTDADFSIMNGGGIRESIQAGEVTRGDVMTVLPFINLIESVEATGQDVLDSFENSVAEFDAEGNNSAGQFLQVSSEVEVTYDLSQEVGSRVVSVEIEGEPIDPDGTYVVGMNDFLASGGDGHESYNGNPVVLSTGELMSELLMDWIQNEQPIPEVEGRINFVD